MISMNTPKREEALAIANDVMQYLLRGGRIEHVPIGYTNHRLRYRRSGGTNHMGHTRVRGDEE